MKIDAALMPKLAATEAKLKKSGAKYRIDFFGKNDATIVRHDNYCLARSNVFGGVEMYMPNNKRIRECIK